MAGLVPAIHVLGTEKEVVDARHKAGHDGECGSCVDRSAYGSNSCASVTISRERGMPGQSRSKSSTSRLITSGRVP